MINPVRDAMFVANECLSCQKTLLRALLQCAEITKKKPAVIDRFFYIRKSIIYSYYFKGVATKGGFLKSASIVRISPSSNNISGVTIEAPCHPPYPEAEPQKL